VVRLLTFLMLVNIVLAVLIPIGLIATDVGVQLAGPLVCSDTEMLVRTGGRNVRFHCLGLDETQRDVSWLPLLMFVPIADTLALAILLGMLQNRRKTAGADPQWETFSGGRTSGFTVQTSSGSQDAKVITFDANTSNPGDPLVVGVMTGEGTKVIEIDPDNATNPVTVRKAKHGEESEEDIESSAADFFQSDIFSQFPNASDNSLKAKLQQLQEAHEAGLITAEEFERKKQALLDAL
jgi:hypothetical protein